MLTKANIKELKALGSTLKISYQIGKSGLTDNALKMFENAIKAHELIKIDVMKSVTDDIEKLGKELALQLKAELVNTIGRTILLYRRNEENPKIRLH